MRMHGTYSPTSEEMVFILQTTLAWLFICLAIGVACYVLQALSLYSLAKRREINKPWLAWIPLANAWILGSLSDQYQYVVKRKVQSRRKVMLGLSIASCVAMVGYLVCFIGMVSRVILVDGEPDGIFAAWFLAAMLLVQAALILLILYTVFHSISLYQVYKSCNPDTAVVFLVLSILISGIQAFFLLADRNLDGACPPDGSRCSLCRRRPLHRRLWIRKIRMTRLQCNIKTTGISQR